MSEDWRERLNADRLDRMLAAADITTAGWKPDDYELAADVLASRTRGWSPKQVMRAYELGLLSDDD